MPLFSFLHGKGYHMLKKNFALNICIIISLCTSAFMEFAMDLANFASGHVRGTRDHTNALLKASTFPFWIISLWSIDLS